MAKNCTDISTSKAEDKYREFSARNYSKFNVDKFIRLVEDKIKQGQGLKVRGRAKKSVNNIIECAGLYSTYKKIKNSQSMKRRKVISR